MKKRNILKKALILVACVYGLNGVAFISNSYIERGKIIEQQENSILSLAESQRKGTEEIAALTLKNEELHNNLEYARQRIEDTSREIDAISEQIAELEGQIERRFNISRGGLPPTGRKISVKVTGYCPCSLCCGEWAYKNPGITASGTVAKFGTVAAPTSLPFGTKMLIEGYGDTIFTVEDTGSAVVYSNGIYVIDMWMPTHEEAYAVGNRVVEAIILD